MPDTSGAIMDAVAEMRRRAREARIAAYVMILILVAAGAASAILFLGSTAAPVNNIAIQVQPGGTMTSADIRTSGNLDWLNELTKAFVRIGGVLVIVFVINILVSFTRYHLKVSYHLSSRADILVICAGDMERLAGLITSVSADLIDFSAVPTNPYDKYIDAVRAAFPGGTRERNTGGDDSRLITGQPTSPAKQAAPSG
ncbi:MAG: hypothetical protein JSS43_15440 [Proteobacteria bacterium]|nr:hypothetical protein [Pseudomonadota bacterium]